jgi:hypothetical protein
MSFAKIILPDSMIADLYKDSLVLIENELNSTAPTAQNEAPGNTEEMILVSEKATVKTIAQPARTLSWLGSNNKNISIIVNDDTSLHLQDELLQILSNILSACKLNLADVAIINTAAQAVTHSALRKELSPRVVVLFGVATKTIDLPFSIPMYKTQSFDNCTYLQAASLEQMKGASNEAKLEKSRLWVCLKTIFGI